MFPAYGSPGWGMRPASLEERRSRLTPGPPAEDFGLPTGLSVKSSRNGIRFVGPAKAVALLEDEFAKLERSPVGAQAHVQGWTLLVQDEIYEPAEPNVIVLPWHAWGMVGRLFGDVAFGWEPNPFDFGGVGYMRLTKHDGKMYCWPYPDIGVKVKGPLLGGADRRRAAVPPPPHYGWLRRWWWRINQGR